MSETISNSEFALLDSQCLEEHRERSIKIKGKDEKTRKAIRNIRDLDVSIRELELQLKEIRAESLNLQLKNCEELRNKLASESPEAGTLAKNTQRFLDLWAAEENNEKLNDKSKAKHDKHVRALKLKDENEPVELMSITDEEKQRLDFFTSDPNDYANETKFDRGDSIADLEVALNPYSIDESSKKLLKQLEDDLMKDE